MADKLTQLRSLYSKMPDGDAKKAVATKIAKLEASQPKEVVEVKEEVKETITKPKATKSASGKDKRHVFEKQVEGGKEVKVVMASSADLAKEAMQESGFEFVKTITRGRSPKEGFIPSGKVKKTKGTKRASKATRDDMAKEAGMTPEKAEKVSEKVAKAKKRGRKPMDKQAYLFEMPLKTQAGKVKRKVVTATSEASAQKSAGKNYTLVKELKAGENPKVGVQAVEGFVAPEPKKRGRKPKAKTLEEVTEKSEAIGEGIAIADEVNYDSIMQLEIKLDKISTDMAEAVRSLDGLREYLDDVATEVDGVLGDIMKVRTKMAHGGKTQGEVEIILTDDDLGYYSILHKGKFIEKDFDSLKEAEDWARANGFSIKKSHAHGGKVLPWANDENAQLGKWLMKNGVGKGMLGSSKSASDLEAKIMSRGKRMGQVAGLEYDNEDVGLQWVAWSDLWDELMSRGVINKNFVDNGKK